MSNKIKVIYKSLFFILPYVIGFIGFMIDDHIAVTDALFSCLTMYFLNYGDSPVNWLVEIARWTAPLATASGIIIAISAIKEKLHNYMIYKSGKSVAVYGAEDNILPIMMQLGKYGIKGGDKFVNAQRYILMYSESENFEFYECYKEKLSQHMTYMKCDTIPSQVSPNSNIKLFSAEEITARLYWKENCIYSISANKNHKLNITFIGFGKLGEEVLYHGLLNNIFSSKQNITYHIFGDCNKFIKVHTQLKMLEDSIIMHNDIIMQILIQSRGKIKKCAFAV